VVKTNDEMGSKKVEAPVVEGMNDGEELLFMGWIVALRRGVLHRVEGDRSCGLPSRPEG
jgi:hypothetical protein